MEINPTHKYNEPVIQVGFKMPRQIIDLLKDEARSVSFSARADIAYTDLIIMSVCNQFELEQPSPSSYIASEALKAGGVK